MLTPTDPVFVGYSISPKSNQSIPILHCLHTRAIRSRDSISALQLESVFALENYAKETFSLETQSKSP